MCAVYSAFNAEKNCEKDNFPKICENLNYLIFRIFAMTIYFNVIFRWKSCHHLTNGSIVIIVITARGDRMCFLSVNVRLKIFKIGAWGNRKMWFWYQAASSCCHHLWSIYSIKIFNNWNRRLEGNKEAFWIEL